MDKKYDIIFYTYKKFGKDRAKEMLEFVIRMERLDAQIQTLKDMFNPKEKK